MILNLHIFTGAYVPEGASGLHICAPFVRGSFNSRAGNLLQQNDGAEPDQPREPQASRDSDHDEVRKTAKVQGKRKHNGKVDHIPPLGRVFTGDQSSRSSGVILCKYLRVLG